MTALMLTALLLAADPKDPPTAKRPPLTSDLVNNITAEKDTLSPKDLIEKLGPPTRYEHSDLTEGERVIADIQMVWEDDARLDMRFAANKLTSVSARYARIPTERFGPAVVLDLKPAMTMAEVSKALTNLGDQHDGPDGPVYRLERKGHFSASIRGGKFAGYTMAGGFHNARQAAALPPEVDRPTLAKALADELTTAARKETLSREDVLKKLGRPDRIDWPHDGTRGPKGSTVLGWEEVTEIEAAFEKGKSVRMVGRFTSALPIERITAENFAKLNHGSDRGEGKPEKEVVDVLGKPASETKDKDGRTVARYGSKRTMEVFVNADGKPVAVKFKGVNGK